MPEQPASTTVARYRALPREVTAWPLPPVWPDGLALWVVLEPDGAGGQERRVLPDAAFRHLYGPVDDPPDPQTLAMIREEVAAAAARMDQPPSLGQIARGRLPGDRTYRRTKRPDESSPADE